MSRNTLFALTALFAIAAGTYVWRYWHEQGARERQRKMTSLLERTESRPHERVLGLDSILEAYRDDAMLRRIGLYHLVKAHADAGSNAATLLGAGERYVAADSSWLAHVTVADALLERGAHPARALEFIERALTAVRALPKPDPATEEKWREQHGEMIAHCERIKGRLLIERGDLRGGIAALRSAAAKAADTYLCRFDLAKAYERAGFADSALAAHMGVVRLKYDHAESREAIGKLYPRLYGWTDAASVIDTLVGNARRARREKLLADTVSILFPDVQMADAAGKELSRADLQGKVVVMDVWATWCGPCKLRMPQLEEAYRRYHGRSDVLFLAVSVDRHRELVRPFIEKHGYTFPVAYGDEEFTRDLGIEGIPTLFVIDAEGTIRFVELGYSDIGDFPAELAWRIDEALKARAIAPKAPEAP